jgi:hypothetical protein
MGEKKERKRCMLMIDVKGDCLPMEGKQGSNCTVAVIDHKDILLGLAAIIKQRKGKGTETHGGLKTNEKGPTLKCHLMVKTQCQSITSFMRQQLFDTWRGPSQPFEQIPLKRRCSERFHT